MVISGSSRTTAGQANRTFPPGPSSGNPIQFGLGKTGARFADLTGDGLNDLVVAGPGWDTPGRCACTGTAVRPSTLFLRGSKIFSTRGIPASFLRVSKAGSMLLLTSMEMAFGISVAGRWDGTTGSSGNVGTPTDPLFNTPVPIRSGIPDQSAVQQPPAIVRCRSR